MSVTSVTEWTLHCDQSRCRQSITGGDGETPETIRAFAESQGWSASDDKDFCHEHWPDN